jgi:hypothetical protein
VVVGATHFCLAGAARQRLARAWLADPHFDHPALFVEAREQQGRRAPAYYLAGRWFLEEALLPPQLPGVLGFDARWWHAARAEHGRDPIASIADGATGRLMCPRCGGPIRYDADVLIGQGWTPARHGMPLGEICAVRGHFVVGADRLHPGSVQSVAEFRAGVEGRMLPEQVWRLADRVPEPEDHLHI